jgi:drug/metabolite transporter (DMT)-like permease
MHFLILCILSSTGIFILFKVIDRIDLPAFPFIVINYLAATLLGFLIHASPVFLADLRTVDWLPASVIIGVLFIAMFFIVGYSTRKAGISVTTVASKMSVIFPIVFSLVIDPSDRLSTVKLAGILCALAGVGFTVLKPSAVRFDIRVIYVPLILFIGMGFVDSLVKYAQHHFVRDPDTALFGAVVFLNAFLSGLILTVFFPRYHRLFLKPSVWGLGILLGGVNFGSIYFVVRALNYRSPAGTGIDSSVVFGVNNIGVVSLSVLAGL